MCFSVITNFSCCTGYIYGLNAIIFIVFGVHNCQHCSISTQVVAAFFNYSDIIFFCGRLLYDCVQFNQSLVYTIIWNLSNRLIVENASISLKHKTITIFNIVTISHSHFDDGCKNFCFFDDSYKYNSLTSVIFRRFHKQANAKQRQNRPWPNFVAEKI